MESLRVSILIPSAYRPRKLQRLLDALYASQLVVPIEVIVSSMENDLESIALLRQYPINAVAERALSEYPGGAVIGWNKLYPLARYEWIAMLADDTVPAPNWLVEMKAAYEKLNKPGLIGLNDLHSDGYNYATHFVMHRQFINDHCGGVLIPDEYQSWWFDVELCEIAKREGVYFYAERAIVEHRHYDWHQTEFDKTYLDSLPLHDVDRAVYERRKAAGFPHGGMA